MPRSRSYYLHLPFFHLVDSYNLRLLYLTRVLKDLVNKVTIFFLPVFLFEIGRTTNILDITNLEGFQRGMLLIGLFFFFAKLLGLIFGVWLGKLIKKIGFQQAFSYSYLFRLVSFLSLFYVAQLPILIISAVIFDAIQSNLFWNSYHTVLSKNSLKTNLGKELSFIQFMLQLVAVAAPAFAGFIGSSFGLESLLLFGIVGTLLSYVVTLSMKFDNKVDEPNFGEFKKWLNEKTFTKLAFAQVGKYVHDSILFLWPLYVYLILGSIEKVGLLYTITLFIVLIFTVFVGNFIDNLKSRKPFYLSGSVLSGLWLARTQVVNVFGIALIDALDKLSSNFHWLYFDLIFLRRGKGRKALSYFVYGEMVNCFSSSIFWLFFSLFFIFFESWNGLFIFAAISIMFTFLIQDRQLDSNE